MDYRCFLEERHGSSVESLGLYESRHFAGQHGEIPQAMLTLLDRAASCLEADEIYVEVGRAIGVTTIAALAHNPEVMAYVIDDPRARLGGRFGSGAMSANRLEKLNQAFEDWAIADRAWLLPSSIEEFFIELRQMGSTDRIGLFFYNGPCDYRSLLVSLLMLEPYLSERAAIVILGGEQAGASQAIFDFLTIRIAGCKLDLAALPYDLPTSVHVLLWDRQAERSHWPTSVPTCPIEQIVADPTTSERLAQIDLVRPERLLSALYDEARAYHAEKRLDRAELAYQSVLHRNTQHVGAQLHLGLLYYEQGCCNQALEALWQTLSLDPANAEAYYGLGLTYATLGEPAYAIAAYHQALERNPKHFNALNNLGNLYYDFDRLARSADLFEQAIEAQPQRAGGYLNRARIELENHDLKAAIGWYKRGLQQCFPNPGIDNGWGDLLHSIDLVQNYQLEPGPLYRQLATHATQQAQPRRALRHYHSLYHHRPTPIYARSLANCYRALNQYEDAHTILTEALNRVSQAGVQKMAQDMAQTGAQDLAQDVALHQLVIQTELDLGQFDRARERSQQAIDACPTSAKLRLQHALLAPIIYDTPDQIEQCRAAVFAGLEWLEQEIDRSLGLASIPTDAIDVTDAIAPADWLEAISQQTNFSLSYQGYDDREFQERYGRLIRRLVCAVYPDLAGAAVPPDAQADLSPVLSPDSPPDQDRSPSPKRIKIGYVSSSMGPSRLGELMIGWIENHDHQQFEIFGYYTQSNSDALTTRFRQACDQFRHQPDRNLQVIAQTIVTDQLDLLIFTDLGIDPLLGVLAAMRLAPVQCTSWSHPITTGLETIDYFLSSATMETETSDRHYSETLIRLADIGIIFPCVALPATGSTTPSQSLGADVLDDPEEEDSEELDESNMSSSSNTSNPSNTSESSPPVKAGLDLSAMRQTLGLAIDRSLLLCCQSLFKYLPQDDEIWVAIATGVPDAQLVFIAHPSPPLTQQFRQRLDRVFAERGLDFAERAIILPRLSEADYLRVNQCCDVFLDSLHWSGGVTTLKAIACGLPIVTCPGELMRSRHSFGILHTLGITETIATTPAEYIAIAIRLAQDSDWREDLRQRTIAQHDRLFNNTAGLQDLETLAIDLQQMK